MANRKKTQVDSEYGRAPEELGSSLFGMELDEDQQKYVNAIWDPNIEIVFSDNPAGTGKTTLAIGVAWMMVKYGRADNIVVVTSPVAEKEIGYRPGTTESKILPYFGSVFDAAAMLGINPYTDISIQSDDVSSSEGAIITCMSHVFLRGRNIPSVPGRRTILIVDEAQNFYIDELQKVLTRVNTGARCIIIGHSGQIDLYHNAERSALAPFIELFKDDPKCAVCSLTHGHRHWVAQKADTIKEFLASKENTNGG